MQLFSADNAVIWLPSIPRLPTWLSLSNCLRCLRLYFPNFRPTSIHFLPERGGVGVGILRHAAIPILSVLHGFRGAVRGRAGARRDIVRAAPSGHFKRRDRPCQTDHQRVHSGKRNNIDRGSCPVSEGRTLFSLCVYERIHLFWMRHRLPFF